MDTFSNCPISEDQKPFNEYIYLKKNQKWIFFSNLKYKKSLLFIAIFLFLFIAIGRIIFEKKTFFVVQWVILNLYLTFFICFLFYCFIYIRWKQNQNRFSNTSIFYEETSWYDIKKWKKPLKIIQIDKDFIHQRFDSIINRIEKTIIYFLLILFYFFVLFQL